MNDKYKEELYELKEALGFIEIYTDALKEAITIIGKLKEKNTYELTHEEHNIISSASYARQYIKGVESMGDGDITKLAEIEYRVREYKRKVKEQQ